MARANGRAARRRRSTGRWSRSSPAIMAWRAQGVSPRPVEATARAVELCAAGGAAINQICLANDLGLKVFDLALHLPTGDITREAALDEHGCAATMAFGMEAIAGGADLLCLGDIGVGNSTVAAAILLHALWRRGSRLGRARLGRGRGDGQAQGGRRRQGGRIARRLSRRSARSAAPRRRPRIRRDRRRDHRGARAEGARSSSTAMAQSPPPRCFTRSIPPSSTIACSQRARPTPVWSEPWSASDCSRCSTCGSRMARGSARRLPPASSRQRR